MAFLAAVGSWFQATNNRRMRAEIFEFASPAPLCVVRFVLGEDRGVPLVQHIAVPDTLAEVLTTIGRRLQVELASSFVGQRELRVHGEKEVVIIKPSALRFWTPAVALHDADAVVAESFRGAPV
jgi:hypothetical protein